MILVAKNTPITLHKTERDNLGRFVATDMSYGENGITVANIHAPNLDNPAFFVNRMNIIEDMENDLVIVGGI